MLVHTGVLGWILSSLAQVGAVVFNDKISTKQKTFLIPQEIADAAVNILSFYVVTSSVKNLASKLVSTGKLSTKNIRHFLEKEGITTKGKNKLDYIGNIKFNIENLDNFSAIKNEYKSFKNGIDVIASTIGSIISCNIITPIARNKYVRESINTTIPNVQRNPGITLAFFTLFCLTVFLIRKTPLLIVINLIKHGIIIKTFLICFLPAAKIVNRP